jgi:hypothetical protein
MLIVVGDDETKPADTVFLIGIGINSALTIDPSSVAFGAVPVGTTVKDTIMLSNTGSAGVSISSYKLASSTTAFVVVDSSAKQVAANGSAKIIISFKPDSAIAYSGTLTLNTDDAGTPQRTINLSGHGVIGSLTASPSPIEFGTVQIGHDSVIHASVKNTGQANVTITKISPSGSSAFAMATVTTPAVIQPGDSLTFDETFTPAVSGDATGSIAFDLSDATVVNLALHGLGADGAAVDPEQVTPSGFSLTLTPNPSHGSVVAQLTMPNETDGKLFIFDEAGHQVLSMQLGVLTAGEHDITLSTAGLISGSYFVQVRNSIGSLVVARLTVR